jgi:hypothetical protein
MKARENPSNAAIKDLTEQMELSLFLTYRFDMPSETSA